VGFSLTAEIPPYRQGLGERGDRHRAARIPPPFRHRAATAWRSPCRPYRHTLGVAERGTGRGPSLVQPLSE
jgi:hypothetical protein